jgi:hypothetical protein
MAAGPEPLARAHPYAGQIEPAKHAIRLGTVNRP